MPARFRRTFAIFPGLKVNVSKGGISFTVGARGFHLNFSKRGVRQTTGLPGSGLSHTSYLFKSDTDDEDEKEKSAEKDDRAVEERDADQPKRRSRRERRERASSPWESFAFILIAVVLIYVGANALGLLPPNLLADFFQTLARWARQTGL